MMVRLPCGAEATEEVDRCIHCPRADQCLWEARVSADFMKDFAEMLAIAAEDEPSFIAEIH